MPAVARAVANLPVDEVILDGEVAWGGNVFHVFDVMWLDGRDVRSLPFVERRALLRELPLAAHG